MQQDDVGNERTSLPEAPVPSASGWPPPAAGEWCPIETAPKDGTTIMVRRGVWAPFHARWEHNHWQPVEYVGTHPPPTLWMPLRAPPAAARRDAPPAWKRELAKQWAEAGRRALKEPQ